MKPSSLVLWGARAAAGLLSLVPCAVMFGAVMLCAGPARADLQLEQFEPRPAGSGLLNVQTPELLPDGGLSLGLWLALVDEPLRLSPARDGDDREGGSVIDQVLRAELVAGYGLFDGVEISAAVPFAQGTVEGDLELDGRDAEELAGAGLGDIRLGVMFEPGRLFGGNALAERWGVGLGLGLVAWMPTGDQARLEGEGNFRFEPRLLLSVGTGRWKAAADLGWHIRPRTTFFSLINDDQLRWRLGLGAPTPLDSVDVEASIFASHHLEPQPDPLDVSRTIDTTDYDPVEALAGLRWRALDSLEVRAGGGAGLTGGVGAPSWRVYLGLGWAWPAEALGAVPYDADPDRDGVLEPDDLCPLVPENKDGVRDEDGCPEAAPALVRASLKLASSAPIPALPALSTEAGPLPDSDGDRVPDEIDLCPDAAEDVDGFEDGDGCPEADDDGDGAADGGDGCPTVAETANGFEDDDGCPEVGADRDGDGIGDVEDACPDDPESKNGVRDWDGCPEGVDGRAGLEPDAPAVSERVMLPPLPRAGDADGDGVADADDVCPTVAEDADGFEDGDGCPEDDPDGDGITDAADACPTLAETVNGFEDGDGCPDVGPDADGDGIEDAYDVCPLEPEGADGLRDFDGCPEWVPDGPPLVDALDVLPPLVVLGDPDGDGLSGDDDGCPMVAEDVDGFEDSDGCPEADDDGDGVVDLFDACSREAETANYYNDSDGCPDVAPSRVAGIIGAVESIQFKVGRSDLRPVALPTLRRVATAMKRYPRLRLQIDGHTDSTGERARNFELSNDRAASVRAWLIGQGIDARRLSSFGYGPDRPVASNRDLQGRYQNRRVELSYTEPGSATPRGAPP